MAKLPDELIQQPVMQALMAGSPPAASAQLPQAAETPIGQLIVKNVEPLKNAGFGFYRSQDGNLAVLFNGLRIHPQEIQQADQQGNLLQVAPPIEQIERSLAANPQQNPVLNAEAPGGLATPPGPQGAPAQPAAGPPAGGGRVASALFGKRQQALETGSPTSGPRPGAGRVMNAILKPVV